MPASEMPVNINESRHKLPANERGFDDTFSGTLEIPREFLNYFHTEMVIESMISRPLKNTLEQVYQIFS